MMLANSNYVRSRIQHIYGREARVVFPPVALAELPCVEDKDDYYVSASFLAPYKRTDLVIRAFNEMPSRRLVIVGEGQQSTSLRALAGPNVTFSGYLPRQDYVNTLAGAKAMVFAGCEDFGIALAEAQACGTPLIAFGRGGAVDIVRRLGSSPEPTGVLFKAQTVAHLKEAVERFEENSHAIAPRACARNAGRFSEENFDRAILESLGAVQALHEIM
jgi:glycosyltransferase involved in cell wall biosynthesis